MAFHGGQKAPVAHPPQPHLTVIAAGEHEIAGTCQTHHVDVPCRVAHLLELTAIGDTPHNGAVIHACTGQEPAIAGEGDRKHWLTVAGEQPNDLACFQIIEPHRMNLGALHARMARGG